MEIRVEGRRVEDESVTLTVRVAASELESLERGACLVVAQRNNIDLGRNETARQLLESALGVSEAASLVTQTMKNFVAPFALSSESEDYSVVGAPIFDADRRLEAEGDLVFDATWTRLGAVTLSSYEPLELAVPPVSVSEAEIDARMEEVAQTYTGVEPDESRTQVAEGDVVQISMDCLKDGERFEQLCFANRLYRAGSGQMPDGFDEALAHAPVGSMVHVDFLLPTREELDGTLSGPSVCAEVKVEAIMREVACVLNDDFISQSIPGASSVVELRELSRKELERQKAEQMRHYRNFLAAGELAKRIEGYLPDAAYDAVADQMIDSLYEQARAQHTTVDELLSAQGSSEEEYRMMVLMQARAQLRQGAALDAWARYRGLEITDADVDAFFASSAQGRGAQMREEVESGGYLYLAREGALRLKASEDLVACSTLIEDASLQMPAGSAPAVGKVA
ncbi:trigger factor [Gordonibacter urolithinfaciens]|uniref:trigger factor n=1 Tax=Gordonibacter urolithinfaciens TaxID=1335613 RepID=UPI003AAB8BA9